MSKRRCRLSNCGEIANCYGLVMRFWLRWAIVTLPFGVFVFLWVRSYWVREDITYLKKSDYLHLRSNRGYLDFEIYGPVSGSDEWSFFEDDARGGPWIAQNLLGFGFEHEKKRNDALSATTVQMPWWAATLVAGFPPLWLYRRHRRRRAGFPIGPDANSKESTQAQTA